MRFSDIPGHEEVKQRLRDMADSGRIPHALLLEGPAGIGKFALARAFAQYVHCSARQNGDSCGRCPSCIQHQSFNHVDTIYSYPVLKTVAASGECEDVFDLWKNFLSEEEAGMANADLQYMDFDRWVKLMGNPNGQPVIYTAESNRIINKFATTSYTTRYKMLLMWLPERMQSECANKLLKMIEEPAEDSLLVFTSDKPNEILPTVYSRLQRIKVRRLDNEEVASYLVRNHNVSAQQAAELASLAEGSILNAVHQLMISKSSDKHLELFMQLMRLAYQRKVADLKKWADSLAAAGRESITRFLDYCVRMTRENFIYNLHVPSLVGMNGAESQFAIKFSPFINERNVMDMLKQFELAKSDIASNGNAKMVLFHLAVLMILLIKR